MAGNPVRIGRLRRLRETLASALLRRHKLVGHETPAMAAIVGDHISDQIRVLGIYERDQLDFLRDHILDLGACCGKAALDIGANIGNHSIYFSKLFARVIAFEPNPLARALLEINLRLNAVRNVDIRPVGLSDRHGTAQLSIPVGNLGAAQLVEHKTADLSATTETVELVAGDDVIDPGISIGLIKIDVEGAETAALAGLRATILRHRPTIMMEVLSAQIDVITGQSPAFSMLLQVGYRAWELRYSTNQSRVSKALALLARPNDPLELVPVERLQQRNYSVLIFRCADS